MILATHGAQTQSFPPVTDQMLANPSSDDWLMFSRTYDAQRHSPLKQITEENVGQPETGLFNRNEDRSALKLGAVTPNSA